MDSSQQFKEQNFNCDICENVFASPGLLKIHFKTIHGQKYKCDSCDKNFTSSGYLKNHIKTIHEGQRNYKCEAGSLKRDTLDKRDT